jgi:hypothetical protein
VAKPVHKSAFLLPRAETCSFDKEAKLYVLVAKNQPHTFVPTKMLFFQ